jgi:hypothetical protein
MKETKYNNTFKKILFISIVSLLSLPMAQQFLNFREVKPLTGDFKEIEKPILTKQGWWSGKYQDDYQNYLNQNIGFRPLFVRVYNQIHYSLYNQAKANGVIIGKDNYLYEENYIGAFLGEDFIGKEEIKEKVRKLKKINDTLACKGIDLIIVLAPGKGSFYPEFIPDQYNIENRSISNYEVYSKEIKQLDLHLLDFNKWFKTVKNTARYPLFPKTGTHWSKYGEMKAADSIIKYLNSIQKENKIPELIIGEVKTSSKMIDTDNDIEKGMNLLFEIKNIEMGYPQFKVQENSNSESPRVLTIADSFYWGMFNFGLSRDVFNNGQFWYYNQQIYPDSYETPIKVEDINIIKEVEKNDAVILMSTDGNLYKFAFGFIDQLYGAYYNKK